MKLIQSFVLAMFAVILFTACNQVSHKKTPGGMPYKLIAGKGTVKVQKGNIIKLNYTQEIKDSIYFTTRGKIPFYMPVTDFSNPYDISEIILLLKKGDSVIATQMMDTFIKRNPENVPPQFRNGDRIITTIRVIDVFTTDSAARLDEEKEKSVFLAAEINSLSKYLADKKINTQKTPSGTFVQVINPGTGDLVAPGKMISVNYTGTGFITGKVFDSNTDTAFNHVEPMTFAVGTGQMIKGFDEAMLFLRPGAEAKLYIPSMLAYGARPNSPNIKEFEHLIFDIKVVGVKDQPDTQQPATKELQKKLDAAQPNK
jgi:FKBP-type peptidyl-prolyl cis-trans isomerase